MRRLAHGFLFIIQYCFYWILYPIANLIYGNKRVWIICERGDDARDNGYWMFKYLSTEHSYVNQYYLIDKKSVDYQKIKSFGKVVKYKSFKHWMLYCAAEVRMTTHLAAFAPGNFIGEWFKHHKQKGINVFLQHGITHNEFPSNYFEHNGSDLFICGAKPEFNHISKECGYPSDNVVFTGFARFDGLHDFVLKKQILVMPSWRNYLYNISKSEFENSLYYKAWSSLLSNQVLREFCSKNNIEILFYPHYELQHFVDSFASLENEVVKIADFNHFDVQTLLKESSLLITDYSSILFDFAYMRKPELLYQFDEDDFYSKHYQRSYFNHRRNGFGSVIIDEDNLVRNIIEICNNDFKLPLEYERKITDFFPIYDDLNCERIYQEIVRKYIKKKKVHKTVKDLNVVITADDYGRNKECTDAILKAIDFGYIQHVSVMTNKQKPEEMCLSDINKNICGLHLNFTEGYASYGDTNVYAYSVNDDSSYAKKEFNNKTSFYKLSLEAKEIIQKETSGQIERFKKMGFECFSFDSHGHIHTRYAIAKVIVPILKENGFQFCRVSSNVHRNHFSISLLYKFFINHYYKKHFKTYNYFCSCDDFIHIKRYRKYKNKTIEVMSHPFIDKYGNLINRRDISFKTLYWENMNEK